MIKNGILFSRSCLQHQPGYSLGIWNQGGAPRCLAQDMTQGKARGPPYVGQVCMLRILVAMHKRPTANFRGAKLSGRGEAYNLGREIQCLEIQCLANSSNLKKNAHFHINFRIFTISNKKSPNAHFYINSTIVDALCSVATVSNFFFAKTRFFCRVFFWLAWLPPGGGCYLGAWSAPWPEVGVFSKSVGGAGWLKKVLEGKMWFP